MDAFVCMAGNMQCYLKKKVVSTKLKHGVDTACSNGNL